MTPQQAIQRAGDGDVLPLYLVMGEEGLLAERVVAALRQAADTGVAAGFNEDRFIAQEAKIDSVLDAARTAPMMGRQRFVQLSGVERWDTKGGDALDRLSDYAADPVPSTVLVLVAQKLHGQRRLVRAAKKDDFLVACTPLSRRELPRWIRAEAARRGHAISAALADTLAELLGPELGPVADALERLSLYAGEGSAIDEAAVAEVVTRVRQETVWAIVDALSNRDAAMALGALDDAYEARDGGLPLLGAIAWRVRQLIKFQSQLSGGCAPKAAAKAAGVPPFKAGELSGVVRRLSVSELEGWLMLLTEADLALKGSRRAGSEVLATMLVDMCH